MARSHGTTTSDLTPAQAEAVLHTDGPLLVLAGAGSGKTRVITRRVAHLLEEGVRPERVLAITFTNKAAEEMRARIEALTGGARVWVSTFHTFCARMLRRFAPRVGYRPDFTILDQPDQLVAVREALVETGSDPKLFGPPKVLHAIERLKDRLKTPAQAEAEACAEMERATARAFGYYQDLLRESNALDFSDLLGQTVALLRQDDVREALSDRFRYLLIDEYQDTNHAQYELARLLAQAHRNVCATGDPDQSIYGWRGADITNILRFEEDYPDARVVKLEENFRSTRLILDAANGLIRRNTERREKDLVTSGPDGAPVEAAILDDEHEEARFVARRVQERLLEGVGPAEIAVFYRVGALSRALETAFAERRIPFQVVGSVAFYQRREVKDLLAYLQLVANPDDDLAAARVINVPPRRVGKATVKKLKERARAAGGSLYGAAEEAAGGAGVALRGRARAGLEEFVGVVQALRALAARERRVEEVLREALLLTRYREYLTNEFPQDEQDRHMNVEALLAGARDFDRRADVDAGPALAPREPQAPSSSAAPSAAPAEPAPDLPLFAGLMPAEPAPAPAAEPLAAPDLDEREPGLVGFLQHTSLMSAAEEDTDDAQERVSLMTVHAAKGLEFDTVFVVGLEDGLFPHSRALEDGSLEEERRLAYVAITRARRRLTLTRANWRTHQGRSQPQRPSLFLQELPPEVFPAGASPREREVAFATYGDVAPFAADLDPAQPDDAFDGVDEPLDADAGRSGWGRRQRPRAWDRPLSGGARVASREAREEVRERARVQAALSRDLPASPGGDLSAGDRVFHEHFAEGVILELTGAGHRRRARVRFDRYGEKDLVLQYARMSKL